MHLLHLGSDTIPGGTAVLTLHHLNDSRSQRILWLLEELGTPYEMQRYQRNAQTRLAPPELKKVHPLARISHTANCSATGDRWIWRGRRGAVALKARLTIWL